MRRRLLVWAGYAVLAVALGYAITSIARLTPLYDQPMLPKENHRTLGQVFDDIGPSLRSNGPLQWKAMLGYLTVPGVVLAVIGVISGVRRHRAATAVLGVWTLSVLASALLLALWPYPRYFAAAIVPLSAFVALGTVAVWDAIVGGTWMSRGWRIAVAAVVLLVALTPALSYESQVIADPVETPYPGADLMGFVAAISAQTWVDPVAQQIERRGGPYPVQIGITRGYTWGLDLRLNGSAVGSQRRFDVFSAVPAAMATSVTPARRTNARGRALPHQRRRVQRRPAAPRLPAHLQQGAPLQRVRHAPLRTPPLSADGSRSRRGCRPAATARASAAARGARRRRALA